MNCIENQTQTWTPCEDLWDNCKEKNYAIIVLNCQINLNVCYLRLIDLWSNAKLRVTVDGGTKKWLWWLEANKCEDTVPPPDLITGDMDSLSLVVLEYLKKRGSKIIKTPDQNETDFTKSLREVKAHCDSTNLEIDTIFVLGDTSGRFDQIIANINTLFKATDFMADKKIYQIASNSITWLLTPGRHRISIPKVLRDTKEWCALLPMGAPCIVTSVGLKWNLDQTILAFGSLVSTSNTYNGEPFVEISTDGFLVFSMGMKGVL